MNIFKEPFRTPSQGTLGQIAQTASQAVSSHRWTLWDSMDGIWSAMGARAIIRSVRPSSHLCDSTDQRKWNAVDARWTDNWHWDNDEIGALNWLGTVYGIIIIGLDATGSMRVIRAEFTNPFRYPERMCEYPESGPLKDPRPAVHKKYRKILNALKYTKLCLQIVPKQVLSA